jgi:hypothetical protein
MKRIAYKAIERRQKTRIEKHGCKVMTLKADIMEIWSHSYA